MNTSVANPNRSPTKYGSISYSIYRVLLRAYPKEFQREYGPHMIQLFGDCRRAEALSGRRAGIVRLWTRTLLDLAKSAPQQHLENFAKESYRMNNLKHDALAVFGCLGIILMAAVLLNYGRTNQVSSILLFGFVLDALVITGILGNLAVFVLMKATKFNPLRIALWAFLVVALVSLIGLAVIGGINDPQFNLTGVTVGYIVSFLFWFGLHWVWSQRKPSSQRAVVE